MKFSVDAAGQNYEIEAPDIETATRALHGLVGNASPAPAQPPMSGADYARGLAASALDIPVLAPAARALSAAGQAALAPLDTSSSLPEPTFGERYQHALDRMTKPLERFREQAPIGSTVANIGGTVAGALALGGTPIGATVLGLGGGPEMGLAGQMARGAASGAGITGIDAALRGQNPVAAGLLGLGLGAAGPAAARTVSSVAAPILSNFSARINPERYAQTQVARGIIDSGRTPGQIESAVAQAAREGQPEFTVADAMGLPGQRLLSTVARAPGAGRQVVSDALEGRQAEQGRRVINQLQEGFGAGRRTAEQATADLQGQLDAFGNAAYPAVRTAGVPVDVTPVIARIDQTLQPGVTGLLHPQTALAPDTIEGALASVRARLTDGRSMLTDFTALNRVRDDVADAAMRAQRAGSGHLASKLGGVKNAIDTVMEAASPGWKAVNREYAQRATNMAQVAEGQTLGQRGRTEDIVRQFTAPVTETGRVTAPTLEGQQAFRTGYVDPLIRKAQNAAPGVNQARMLSGVGFRDEAAVLAPGNARLQRQLEREMTMFETRAQALKGSGTAQNLADAQAGGIDPAIIGHLVRGNVTGALHRMAGSISETLDGNTAAVREQIARIILADGRTPRGQLQAAIDQTVRRIQTIQKAARAATGAATLTGAAQFNR